MGRITTSLFLASLTLAGSCASDPVAPDEEEGLCRNAAGEFALFGCAVITGTVTDTAGRPLPHVRVVFDSEELCCGSGLWRTEEDGRFTMTIDLWVGELRPVRGDVRAACLPRRSSPQDPFPPPISESTPVTLEFAPPRTAPDTTRFAFSLPVAPVDPFGREPCRDS